MDFDIDKAEKIIESGKKKPKKTLLIFFLFLISLAIIAFVTNYFGAKGKQLADPSKLINEQSKDTTKIDQHTEGDQSPAIVTNGEVNIIFKNKNMDDRKE